LKSICAKRCACAGRVRPRVSNFRGSSLQAGHLKDPEWRRGRASCWSQRWHRLHHTLQVPSVHTWLEWLLTHRPRSSGPMGGQRAFSADASTPFAGAYWRLGNGNEDCSATCAMYAGCVAQAFSLTTLADMQSILGSAGLNSTFCTPTARFGQSTCLADRILQFRALCMQCRKCFLLRPVLREVFDHKHYKQMLLWRCVG